MNVASTRTRARNADGVYLSERHGAREAWMIFDVPDPDFEQRIRTSFARQGLNKGMGATLGRVAAGLVEIELPFSFFHGGVMGAIGDSARGDRLHCAGARDEARPHGDRVHGQRLRRDRGPREARRHDARDDHDRRRTARLPAGAEHDRGA